MPKVTKGRTSVRSTPLAEQLMEDDATRNLRIVPKKKEGRRKENDEDKPEILSSRMTQKLFDSLAEQNKEEDEKDVDLTGAKEAMVEEIEEEIVVDESGYLDIQCLDEEEEAMRMFLPQTEQNKSMNAMILETIHERTMNSSVVPNEAVAATAEKLHGGQMAPKIIQVYTDIGKWMKKYKSGRFPKPFMVIPSLQNWEEVLCLTNPLSWSPNAMREATKIFASQLNYRMAQRFYNLVLLPAIRQDMAEHKKLNFHYYEALKKAMFKPAAFMKGILLPLAQESCTLREAHILSTILQKISVPVLHGSAVLIRLAEMTPWFGTTAMFMSVLINKKYSLPYSVISKLCDHFYSFVDDERELPLVFHRNLLIFLQRYKSDIGDEGRNKMRHLLKVHWHAGIGEECKRELLSIAARGNQQIPSKDVDMDL